MSVYTFIPYELPKSKDGTYQLLQLEHQILLSRREQLGLTQQQVADMAHIQLRQYQRMESGERYISGCSMRIGLSICAVLLLDPYDFMHLHVRQPDPKTMRPQRTFDADPALLEIDQEIERRRRGRKPIRRDVKRVYLNHDDYGILIPCDVLIAMGSPDFIQFMIHEQQHSIAIRAVNKDADKAIDVPEAVYEGHVLALPMAELTATLRKDMGWDDEIYAADARLVKDPEGRLAIIADAYHAEPSQRIDGPFIIPDCANQ